MDGSNTERKRGGKPFVKGDARINRKGRPRGFDDLRKIVLKICDEKLRDKDGNETGLTVIEGIMRQWAMSKNPLLQKTFVEIAYGKIPENIDVPTNVIMKVIYKDENGN